MLVLETIEKVRRIFHKDRKSIKQICRELRMLRNTARRVVLFGATEPTYERSIEPQPKF